ncbi:MAG: lytic transglycosylase domain-containing protein [Schwartzia sp.]|nr:lytic transglycosylase domain-containing protein [Schwartzia sp. (in: firmicutes)]
MKVLRIFALSAVFLLCFPFFHSRASAADVETVVYWRVSQFNDNPEIASWITQAIMYASSLYQVDPLLVAAVMQAESAFNINVGYSRAGAIGLMQLMPDTAEMIGVNPYDPLENVVGGASYLRTQLNNFSGWGEHGVAYAIAAYNAGGQAVRDVGGCPDNGETYEYVCEVANAYNGMLALYNS